MFGVKPENLYFAPSFNRHNRIACYISSCSIYGFGQVTNVRIPRSQMYGFAVDAAFCAAGAAAGAAFSAAGDVFGAFGAAGAGSYQTSSRIVSDLGRETGPWERPHTDQPRYFVFRVFNYNKFDWCSSWGDVSFPLRRASNSTILFFRCSICQASLALSIRA